MNYGNRVLIIKVYIGVDDYLSMFLYFRIVMLDIGEIEFCSFFSRGVIGCGIII